MEKKNFIENDFELMLKLAELFRNKKSLQQIAKGIQ
jgi:hypothetical protein